MERQEMLISKPIHSKVFQVSRGKQPAMLPSTCDVFHQIKDARQKLTTSSGSMCSSSVLQKMCFAVTLARGKKKKKKGLFLVVSIWIIVKFPAIHRRASNPQALRRWGLGVSPRWHISRARGRSHLAPLQRSARRAASGEGAATASATKEDWGRGKALPEHQLAS